MPILLAINISLPFFDICYDILIIYPGDITPNNALYSHVQYDTLLLDHTLIML